MCIRDRVPTPRRWLLVASVAPWLVFAGLMVTRSSSAPAPPPPSLSPAPTAPDDPGTDDTERDVPAPAADAARTTAPTSPPMPATTLLPSTTTTTDASVDARAEAIAVGAAAVRLWLSTQPTTRTIDGLGTAPGADTRYVEHVVVEHLDHPAGDLAVLTVLAMTLPVDTDGYRAPDLLRVAVPIRMRPDATTIAGTPWFLPAPNLRVDPVVPRPSTSDDDLDLAAHAAVALAEAGYGAVEVRALATTDSWPLLVTVMAVAPGTTTAAEQTVLLRRDLGRLVVAGHVTPTPNAPTEDEP